MELVTYPQAYRNLVGHRPEGLDDAERVRAAKMAAERSTILREAGWVERSWVPRRGRPLARKSC